jgi:hypothetical protein
MRLTASRSCLCAKEVSELGWSEGQALDNPACGLKRVHCVVHLLDTNLGS